MIRLLLIPILSLCCVLPVQAVQLPGQVSQPQIGVQLWSVRDAVAADFDGTLMALAELGFDGVEFAGDYGSYGADPEGLRTFMDEAGLACAGAHVRYPDLVPDQLDEVVAFHQVLGCPALIIALDERAFIEEEIEGFIEDLNQVNDALAGTGIALGYHNHWQEFESYAGSTYWDALAQGTPDEFIMQLDVRHAAYAGKSPLEYLERYPERTFSTHFKAFVPEGGQGRTIIGDDSLDWPALYEMARVVGGTQWIIVEQEVYPDGLSPMECTALSLAALQAVVAMP